jgi:hypothetical protein
MIRKLGYIFYQLKDYAKDHVKRSVQTGIGRGQIQVRESDVQVRSASAGRGRSGSRGAGRGTGRAQSQKRKDPEVPGAESTEKRRKSASESRSAAAGSSASALTTVQAGKPGDDAPIQKFELAGAYQKVFWNKHKPCFIFEHQTFDVDISKCFLAPPKYIIRKLEMRMVMEMTETLVHIGSVKQRQTICVTPCDKNKKLLKVRPQTWDEIKDGEFLIINGQHSITASKLLQKEGCCEERKIELQKWEATIVWSLKPEELTEISKWYNSANHLIHSQPTWGNQISACRQVWIDLKRPSNVEGDAIERGNAAVYSPNVYKVSHFYYYYLRVEDKFELAGAI